MIVAVVARNTSLKKEILLDLTFKLASFTTSIYKAAMITSVTRRLERSVTTTTPTFVAELKHTLLNRVPEHELGGTTK